MGNWSRRRFAAVGGAVALVGVVGFAMLDRGAAGIGGQGTAGARLGQEGGAAVAGARSAGSTAAARSAAVLTFPSKPATQWGELSFTAEGFRPNEWVGLLVEQGGTMKEAGRVQADAQGEVKDARILLPSWLESGNRAARAVGASSGTQAAATLYVRAKNLWINLKSYTLQQAGKVGLIAGGFEPGDRIRVYLTQGSDSTGTVSQQPLASMTADESGNTAWTEATVPVLQPGKYELQLKGDSTQDVLKADVTVDPIKPDLELSPWSGLPGRQVNLNAKGFLPNEDVEAFVGTGGQATATFKADQYGGIWGAGPVNIPTGATVGPLPVTLRGKSSGAEVTRDFSVVAPHPWVELSSYSGFTGSPVMVHGGGFGAGEHVSLHVGSASSPSVGEAVVADENGYYQGLGPAQVPDGAGQQVAFVVLGQSSGAQAEASYKVMQPFVPER